MHKLSICLGVMVLQLVWHPYRVDAQDPRPRRATSSRSTPAQREQFAGWLVQNNETRSGHPPYGLVDEYGVVQRFIEPASGVDLERFIGRRVAVRSDTGDTLLATQLALPRTTPKATTGSSRSGSVRLADFVDGADNGQQSVAEELPQGDASPTEKSVLDVSPPDSEYVEGEYAGIDDYMGSECGPSCGVECGAGCGAGCGCGVCRPSGCACGARGRWYVRGEGAVYWADGMYIPALVITGEAGDNNGEPFIDNAQIIFGEEEILTGSRGGGQITVGHWIDRKSSLAIEGDYLGTDTITRSFVAGGPDGSPVIGRPFFDIENLVDGAELVVFPNIVEGFVSVAAASEFDSAGIRFRKNACCKQAGVCTGCPGCGFVRATNIDYLAGYRYLGLEEALLIREDLTVLTDGPDRVRGDYDILDAFRTRNRFHGGELGVLWERNGRRWSLELLAKIAIGATHQLVEIGGQTTFTQADPPLPPETLDAGILALSTNSGRFRRNKFSMIPEIGATLGYRLTPRLRATIGYSLLFWASVVRPGDQIDLDVNTSFWPDFSDPPTPSSGPERPRFAFRETDIWLQGLRFGLDYRW